MAAAQSFTAGNGHVLDLEDQRLSEGFYHRYTEQRRKHAEVLGRFERDMEALSTVEIPPQARTPELARLSDLVPGQRVSVRIDGTRAVCEVATAPTEMTEEPTPVA